MNYAKLQKMKLFSFWNHKHRLTESEKKFKLTFQSFSKENSFPKKPYYYDLKVYNLLYYLNFSSSENETRDLITTIKGISFNSNCNSVFEFFLPIVSHTLYYKPQYSSEILGLLIGPLFALGLYKEVDFIEAIKGNMDFNLKEKPHYLTEEGMNWVNQILPKLKNEINVEIDNCIKELSEE